MKRGKLKRITRNRHLTDKEATSLAAIREKVEAEYKPSRPVLWLRAVSYEEQWFIAIHKDGFGVDTDPAKAVLMAQESVAMDAKPSQLLLYRHTEETAPTGFVEWPNGVKPKLVGLTNTHQGWIRRQRH